MANIKDILNSIKLAIRSKGVSVADCDSPEVYPEKILQIKRTVSDATDTVCIHAYCSSQNTPSKPTGNPYNFSTGAITYPEGWSNPDNLSGNIWESHIVVTSNTSVQNGIVEDWTKPIKIIASYNLEDILDYDALNEEISQKIAEDYQEVYEDYQTAISELQNDVERYKNKTDTLEGEYENLAIKTTEDLGILTQNVTEQVLNSEGFTTKVTSVLNEGEYVTQTDVEQTAKSVVATALDGEINEDGELVGGRMAQLELSVDEIDSKVTNGDNYARIIQRINEQDGTSEITLDANKINLAGQDNFFTTLKGSSLFATNISAERLTTTSETAKIVIENGELAVYQHIYDEDNDSWSWVKRISLGYDTFRQDVAIVIYDESENPVLDLTKDSLQSRTDATEQITYELISSASWSEISGLSQVSDSAFVNYEPNLSPHIKAVAAFPTGNTTIYKYTAAKYKMLVNGVDNGIVYQDPADGQYKSSVEMNGKFFTTSLVNWTSWRSSLVNNRYRQSIPRIASGPCPYEQTHVDIETGEVLLDYTCIFTVTTFDAGEISTTRTCQFTHVGNIRFVDSEIPVDRWSEITDDFNSWSIRIDKIKDEFSK